MKTPERPKNKHTSSSHISPVSHDSTSTRRRKSPNSYLSSSPPTDVSFLRRNERDHSDRKLEGVPHRSRLYRRISGCLTIFVLSFGFGLFYWPRQHSSRSFLRSAEIPQYTSDFSPKPTMVATYYSYSSGNSDELIYSVSRINPLNFTADNPLIKLSINAKRTVDHVGRGTNLQHHIEHDSDDFSTPYQHPNAECVHQHDWQSKSFPTCNSVHEQDMYGQLHREGKFFLGGGIFRNVWYLEASPGDAVALKTMAYNLDWTGKNVDRQRLDALVSERLTRSPNIMNIYGYCGDAALYELANGGSLEDAVKKGEVREWTTEGKYKVALQMVNAVADLHDIDHNGVPSVTHDDLDISQFVSVDGSMNFKLNDFNGARFVDWNKEDNTLCKFNAAMMGGKYRSPEEYRDDQVNEKIDIFSLGYSLYALMTDTEAWTSTHTTDVRERIESGARQPIYAEYAQNDDPIIQAFVKAIKMCWIHDPSERASAKDIQKVFLEAKSQ